MVSSPTCVALAAALENVRDLLPGGESLGGVEADQSIRRSWPASIQRKPPTQALFMIRYQWWASGALQVPGRLAQALANLRLRRER